MKAPTNSRLRDALTLIELVGVLAVLAVLAAAIVPVLIRQMDRIASDLESASLRSVGGALRQSILRTRTIPSHTNWAATVAAEMGASSPNVTTNARNLPRFFLIDPNLSIAGAGLPYTQTIAGASTMPVSPRLMVVSSIGQPLVSLSSGVPSSADFNAIWNWNDASSTPPSASGLAGFTRGGDLKVERINLASQFVYLILTSYASNTTNGYSIDSTNWAGSHVYVPPGAGIARYFLKNSNLTLYKTGGAIDSQQVLYTDSSFVYNMNVWSASINGAQSIGGLDLTGVADRFLKSPPNINPNVPRRTEQQKFIVTNMMTYMAAYVTWANSGFTSGKTALNQAQSAMVLSVRQIFEPGGGANDFTPWPYQCGN